VSPLFDVMENLYSRSLETEGVVWVVNMIEDVFGINKKISKLRLDPLLRPFTRSVLDFGCLQRAFDSYLDSSLISTIKSCKDLS
jgi:hypothetical protein